jgi:ABC-2 type transport system ATP-binding protein
MAGVQALEGVKHMETMLEARGLAKTFKGTNGKAIQAVKSVDLDIGKGEIFSLLGPNGAGKTTTISMIGGLVEPTAGDARIGGFSIRREPMQAKALLGYVPQEIALYRELSARRNLEFFGRMYGLAGKDLATRVDEVLEFIDLTDRQNDRVESFSGGMMRRVNIGVGLLHRPAMIYMDEPTVGVDPQSRRRVLDTVFRLRDEFNMTVLYTTHLMEEAQELSDRVAIIDHGEIIALGTQGELVQQIGEEDRLVIDVERSDGRIQALASQMQEQIPGVRRVMIEAHGEGTEAVDRVTVFAMRGRAALPKALNVIESLDLSVLSVQVREPNLEDVFLEMTGRALRD